MKPKTNSEIVLYQAADGKTRLEVQFQGETAWLSLNQMAELFQRDKSVISKHIKNAFDEGELDWTIQVRQQILYSEKPVCIPFVPRRSPRMTHMCSSKVTHFGNAT